VVLAGVDDVAVRLVGAEIHARVLYRTKLSIGNHGSGFYPHR
jgi:hypothetical protein